MIQRAAHAPAATIQHMGSCAFFEQEATETTEKAPALCSLSFLLFMIPGFIWLRPKAALVNRDPAGTVSASRSPLGRG